MANPLINVRVPPADRAALLALSRRTGLPQSALMRAGLRAVVQDPRLIWSAPPADYVPRDYAVLESDPWVDDEPSAPPPPPRSKKRRNRR
jgi:hypothetical protein